MSEESYTKVSLEKYLNYQGLKKSESTGDDLQYFVRNDEDRPVSPRSRELADKMIEFLKGEGLIDDLATGGIGASLAISYMAEAIVTVCDESLPQYARPAVDTFKREVERHTKLALDWSVGATYSSETTLQRREREDPPTPGF